MKYLAGKLKCQVAAKTQASAYLFIPLRGRVAIPAREDARAQVRGASMRWYSSTVLRSRCANLRGTRRLRMSLARKNE